MKIFYIFIIIFIISCNKKEKIISSKLLRIPYNLQSNYTDSIVKKIKPNIDYDYWQYVTFFQSSNQEQYTVLAEGGNLSLKNKINTKIKPLELYGLFEGGHPSYRANFLVVLKNNKIKYIDSMEQLRDFIGKIDNLEEAILFARTHDYHLSVESSINKYNFSNGVYKINLIKYSRNFPESYYKSRGELIEVSINIDGFMKTKALKIYCEGIDCF
jgi:hypothetical protein